LKISVEELNGDLRRKPEPLEREADQIKKRLEEIDGEIGRYVKALGQGKLSIERLESEIAGLETDKYALQKRLDDLRRKINESAARDFNAELLQRTLRDFRSSFAALTAPEKSEALQCVIKSVTVHPQKLDLEIFELQEFLPGSQNRKEWLRGLDSNQDNQLQRLACYQLHYPGIGKKSVADLALICYSRTPYIFRSRLKKSVAARFQDLLSRRQASGSPSG
jgi:chromosome segregation ATPase